MTKTIYIVVKEDESQLLNVFTFEKELEAQLFIKGDHDATLADYEADGEEIFSDFVEDDVAYIEVQDQMEWVKWELFIREIEC